MDSSPSSSSSSEPTNKNNSLTYPCYVFSFLVLPISLGFILYNLDLIHDSSPKPRLVDGSILSSLQKVGSGPVTGPEDLVYDPVSKALYTGCEDGWIKRVRVGDGPGFEEEVEEVVNTGGRPLGLALSPADDGNDVIIADGYKGLLKLTKDGEVVQLSKEAEGKEFKLIDGVDVAQDGIIYFTDASSKHGLDSLLAEQLSGRPEGRLLSFDPATRDTRVLLRDLDFPNGITLAPDQASLIFCETMLRMCKRYHIKGTLAGTVEPFINDTFGSPDNIHYDNEGQYWIGLPAHLPRFLYKLMDYSFVQNVMILVEKYIGIGGLVKSAGILAVDLEGNPIAHLYDSRLSAITSGVKVGELMYLGSFSYDHIFLMNLTQYGF